MADQEQADAAQPTPSPGSVTISVTGMHCAACVGAVERALEKVEGVSDARVNFASGKASVDFDPQLVSLQSLETAIRDAGYEPAAQDEGAPAGETADREQEARRREMSALRLQFVVSALLGLPLL